MLSHHALVVVADDRSARLFRNTARQGVYLTEIGQVTRDSVEPTHPGPGMLSTVAADDPGGFVRKLADHLNAMALRNGFEDIAIVAAPAVLDPLRRRYHKELQFRLRREIGQSMIDADVRDISAALI